MKIDASPLSSLSPMVADAILAARKASLAIVEEKTSNTQAAHMKADPNAPIQGDRQSGVQTESALERIREIGMSAYAQEIKAEKIEAMKRELREQILSEMGLSEDKLAKMPPKRRAEIEAMIEAEIQKRLAAINALQNEENDDRDKKGILSANDAPFMEVPGGGKIISRTPDFGPGFGVLLALQEADVANERNLEPKSKPDGERGY